MPSRKQELLPFWEKTQRGQHKHIPLPAADNLVSGMSVFQDILHIPGPVPAVQLHKIGLAGIVLVTAFHIGIEIINLLIYIFLIKLIILFYFRLDYGVFGGIIKLGKPLVHLRHGLLLDHLADYFFGLGL